MAHFCVTGVSAGLHYLPDGKNFIYAAGGCIVMCNFDDPHQQTFLRGHDQNVTCMSISKTGRYLASGQYGENADVIVWDLQTKELLYRFGKSPTWCIITYALAG